VASWFQRDIIDADRLAPLLCFASLVVTFLVTRTITALIRAGKGPFKDNVSSSGVHVHHAIPGLILLVVGAFTSVSTGSESPWAEISAVLIGVGTSLVLDEFALILYLSDVYWASAGRVSVHVVAIAIACMGLALVGLTPVSAAGFDDPASSIAAIAVGCAVQLVLIVICISKGKYQVALFSTFIPVLAFFGAIRLARPTSVWARKRYRSERKRARAQVRAERYDHRFGRFTTLVGRFVEGSTPATDRVVEAAHDQAAH
jgi:hypothetical protein